MGGGRQAEATTAGPGGKASGGAADPSASEEKELQAKVNNEVLYTNICFGSLSRFASPGVDLFLVHSVAILTAKLWTCCGAQHKSE